VDSLLEAQRKKRLFNRSILVAGLGALLYFVGYTYFTKRTDRHYVLPAHYTGWVTIRYEKPGAPPLEKKDGHYLIHVNDSGYAETSSRLETGWARDEFFESGSLTPVPKKIDSAGGWYTYVHEKGEFNMDYTQVLLGLPENADTVLWEGSQIHKRGQQTDIKQGRKIIEHFYFTSPPALGFSLHDSLPSHRKIW
jgi:hypothetical protein